MIGVLSFIFVLGTGVLIHELGHFLVAKRFGILCHEFSIGMGPALWKKRKGETVYTLRAIPVGGYVSMAGEEVEKDIIKIGDQVGVRLNARGIVERIFLNPDSSCELVGTVKDIDLYRDLTMSLAINDDAVTYTVSETAFYEDLKGKTLQQIAPRNRCLESKSKFARIATMAAGALMNFALAFAFLLIVGLIQGDVTVTNRIASIDETGAAHQAGLVVGDTIIEYNGYTITTGEELVTAIRSTTEETTATILRNGQTKELTLTPIVSEVEGVAVPLIGIGMDRDSHFSIPTAFRFATTQYRNTFDQMFLTFRMLFVTHEAGVRDLSGPVGILHMTSQVVDHGGFLALLIFANLINVNLGLLNLMPLPALDGGRIIFVLLEAIAGRPINRKVEGYIHMTGLILFMGLFVFIFINDITRLFG